MNSPSHNSLSITQFKALFHKLRTSKGNIDSQTSSILSPKFAHNSIIVFQRNPSNGKKVFVLPSSSIMHSPTSGTRTGKSKDEDSKTSLLLVPNKSQSLLNDSSLPALRTETPQVPAPRNLPIPEDCFFPISQGPKMASPKQQTVSRKYIRKISHLQKLAMNLLQKERERKEKIKKNRDADLLLEQHNTIEARKTFGSKPAPSKCLSSLNSPRYSHFENSNELSSEMEDMESEQPFSLLPSSDPPSFSHRRTHRMRIPGSRKMKKPAEIEFEKYMGLKNKIDSLLEGPFLRNREVKIERDTSVAAVQLEIRKTKIAKPRFLKIHFPFKPAGT